MSLPAHRRQIVLTIPDLPLEQKLDLVAATLQAVRDAHKDTMSPTCWAELTIAGEHLAAATLASNAIARFRALIKNES